MCGFCFLKSCFVPSKSITCPVVHVAVLENFSEDTMKETSGACGLCKLSMSILSGEFRIWIVRRLPGRSP